MNKKSKLQNRSLIKLNFLKFILIRTVLVHMKYQKGHAGKQHGNDINYRKGGIVNIPEPEIIKILYIST